ncbi:SNARE associated protein-related protein [Haladaptatus sp. W1]|uniref:DedA family protein n=1 Tax=Haladaptatus sp. W1 TaxID=1897478 RepID=UPI0008498FC6|nr:DedA family protein [Haladaptatus sp. W1]ODR82442.1 SNARE associated protein-related protein [Haladaptatus sp. W1]
MFDWLANTILSFVVKYGYLAVFIYLTLETAFILHFAPSEIVVPFAATQLVHDPMSFGFFVAVSTAGATAGSLLGYYAFGRNGKAALDRYGHILHVSESDLERSQRWFRRWGRSSVLWGRMLPLMRAIISIPAGIAEMDVRTFTVYSASGSLVFNVFLTYLVYEGAGETSPLDWAITTVSTTFAPYIDGIGGNWVVIAGIGVVLAVGTAGIWLAREHLIREVASQR